MKKVQVYFGKFHSQVASKHCVHVMNYDLEGKWLK